MHIVGALYGLLVLFTYGICVLVTGQPFFFLHAGHAPRTSHEDDGTLEGQISFLVSMLLTVQEYRLASRSFGLLCIVGAFPLLFLVLRAVD